VWRGAGSWCRDTQHCPAGRNIPQGLVCGDRPWCVRVCVCFAVEAATLAPGSRSLQPRVQAAAQRLGSLQLATLVGSHYRARFWSPVNVQRRVRADRLTGVSRSGSCQRAACAVGHSLCAGVPCACCSGASDYAHGSCLGLVAAPAPPANSHMARDCCHRSGCMCREQSVLGFSVMFSLWQLATWPVMFAVLVR
jgi:hypothetical protein